MSLSLTYFDTPFYIILTILCTITVFTVVGNTLVFIALFKFNWLRSTPNLLIGNLAASDLLLAVAILPFSSANDAMGYWVFGARMCDIWLGLDVLFSTASVWGLVVIALDRYTATSSPVWYRGAQSKRRTFNYAVFVWIFSGLICLPGFLGWGSQMSHVQQNTTVKDAVWNRWLKTKHHATKKHIFNWKTGYYDCYLYNELWYIIYSAMGSFIIPLVIMVGLYTKIYFVLRSRGKMLRKRRKITSVSSLDGTSLSIHHCKLSSLLCSCKGKALSNEKHDLSYQVKRSYSKGNDDLVSSFTDATVDTDRQEDQGDKSSTQNGCYTTASQIHTGEKRFNFLSKHATMTDEKDQKTYPAISQQDSGPASTSKNEAPTSGVASTPIDLITRIGVGQQNFHRPSSMHFRCTWHRSTDSLRRERQASMSRDKQESSITFRGKPKRKESTEQARADRRERRATKRIGLLIFIFALSWIPFTLMYLTRGLCGSTCPDRPNIQKFVTWLGYGNSGLNPVLYAVLNSQFRRAFLRILHLKKSWTMGSDEK